MLNLGQAAPQDDNAVRDGSDASFMQDVVEASREAAVIVDFWAPWCGPCKTLGPALEAAVKASKGRARLVKIDIDQHQQVAAQMRVQSIPAVFAFVDGQPVDGFMGAVSPKEAQEFVTRVAAMGRGGDPIAEALEQGETALAEGAAGEAAQLFSAVAQEQPDNMKALGGLARAFLALGETAQARAVLDQVPPQKAHEEAIQSARAALELAEQTAETGEAAELRARLEADPTDHQARHDLALALIGQREHQAAIDELLELFRRDRDWNEGAARAQLVKLFETLGPKSPVAASGRRRLSSMLFS